MTNVFDEVKNITKNNMEIISWAASTVMTRQNLIPVNLREEGEKVKVEGEAGESAKESAPNPVLIPLWDMANHVNGQITTGYNEAAQQVESLALGDYRKGEQIFIYYGNRTNADFLVHNGFVYPDNANSAVAIPLSLNPTEEQFEQRKQLLEKLGLASSGDFNVQRGGDSFISPELLGFARVFNMTKEQLGHWLGEDAVQSQLLEPDCPGLEASLKEKVWKYLSIRLQLALRMTGTTLDQDEALLANQGQKGAQKLGHIKSMLVQFRVVEKKILSEALEHCKQKEVDKKEV